MKQGQLLLLSSGMYSDYAPIALTRVLKDFKTSEVVEEYLKLYPKQRELYEAEQNQFTAWLASEGYIEDVPHTEWNIGSYASIEGMDDD